MTKNEFRNSLSSDNIVTFEDGEIKIRNIVTKQQAEANSKEEKTTDESLSSRFEA